MSEINRAAKNMREEQVHAIAVEHHAERSIAADEQEGVVIDIRRSNLPPDPPPYVLSQYGEDHLSRSAHVRVYKDLRAAGFESAEVEELHEAICALIKRTFRLRRLQAAYGGEDEFTDYAFDLRISLRSRSSVEVKTSADDVVLVILVIEEK